MLLKLFGGDSTIIFKFINHPYQEHCALPPAVQCSGTASWKVGGSNKELVKDVWRGFTGGDLLLLDGLNFELDMDTQFETSI